MRLSSAIFCASISVTLPIDAHSKDLPSPALFNSLVTTCATGSSTEFSADLIGSVANLYEGNYETEGTAKFLNVTKFLEIIPEADRLKAYELYTSCIKGIMKDVSSYSSDSLEELILVLNARARDVKSDLPDNARLEFAILHEEHIEALNKGNFILAHEVLRQIQNLIKDHDDLNYHDVPEYGYIYPGSFDDPSFYKALSKIEPNIVSDVAVSLFVGLLSTEYPRIYADSGFSMGMRNQVFSLYSSIDSGDYHITNALLVAGYNVNARLTSKLPEMEVGDITPLMLAAYRNDPELIELLLDHGAKFDLTNENNETALDIAIKFEAVAAIDALKLALSRNE